MEKISKNDKQTPESVKFPLEVRERQNKSETLNHVKKFLMGLPLSPKQFKELFLQRPSNKASKFYKANCRLISCKN